MPSIYITRLRKTLDLRLKQGFTKTQIARAADITADDIDAVLDREDLTGVSAIDLDALMRALFVDDGYVFEGTAHVQYSPCSFQRLLIQHYGQPEANTDEGPSAAVEERFIPTWEEQTSAQYVLIVGEDEEFNNLTVYGPFDTKAEAEHFLKDHRAELNKKDLGLYRGSVEITRLRREI